MKKLIALLLLAAILMYCNTPSADSTSSASDSADNAEMTSEDKETAALYTQLCSGCHGAQILAFAGHRWRHGKERADILKSINFGIEETDMIAWSTVLSEDQINGLADYIVNGIKEVEKYGFQEEKLESDTFKTELITIELDTIVKGMTQPWGMVWLPSGDMLVTEQSGEIYRIDENLEKIPVTGEPTIRYNHQGGLLDLELHPDFENNNWLYVSYSDLKVENGDTVAGTALNRYKFVNDRLTNEEVLFEAHPYGTSGSHFGGRIEFDKNGYLFLSVGDRRKENENPQSLANYNGKVHRMNDDGSIPADNPFVGQDTVMQSIYSYGHRNPQGLALNPTTGEIWAHEHGPRGGDEVNIIRPATNYGWPVISYGIEYDGTTFTNMVEKEGMAQPVVFWVPSIAPSGATFVNTDKYPGWEGNFLAGSLRFRYLNRCVVEGNEIVKQEPLMKGIGRLRNVRIGPDGFIYVAVEEPGYVFRLMPINTES